MARSQRICSSFAPLRFLSLLFFLAAPVFVHAQFLCATNDGTLTIVYYMGSDPAVVVPDAIDGLPVTSIGFGAFSGRTNLTSITLPNSVTNLGDSAFSGCTGLTNITLPNQARYIGARTFAGCQSLTGMVIPNSVISFGYAAFSGCTNLSQVTLPDQMLNVSEGMFSGCGSLTSIVIPNSVTNIGYDAFTDCYRLASVSIGQNVTTIQDSAFRMCLGLTNVTIPDGVTDLGVYLFSGCSNLLSVALGRGVSHVSPNTFNCPALQSITVDARNPNFSSVAGVFFNHDQTTLLQYPEGKSGRYAVPNSVTSIGDYAFASCLQLTGVTLPDSLTNIGIVAFAYCSQLTSITIPSHVIGLGGSAFVLCVRLAAVEFKGNAPNIDDGMFYGEHPTIYYMPDTTGWNASAYFAGFLTHPVYQYGANNGTITIWEYSGVEDDVSVPAQINGLPVTAISGYAFSFNQFTKITLPASLTTIRPHAFETCYQLSRITIPDGVTNLDDWAFAGCPSLASIDFGAGLTRIGYAALGSCGFTNVTVPSRITSIDDFAFACTNLTAITVEPGNPNYRSVAGVLFNSSLTTLMEYPANRPGNYLIPNSVTNLAPGAFACCRNLSNITIPPGITRIPYLAFEYSPSLTTISVPASVTNFADNAFYSCPSLASVYCQGNAPSLGLQVFDSDYRTIVYYSPGATGWGNTLANRPTVLWNAQVQTSRPMFGVQGDRFGFPITGASNLVVVVEACTNLTNPIWSPISTNTLAGGLYYFLDPAWTNSPGRFYRLRSP